MGSDLQIKDASGTTRTLPLYGAAYGAVVSSIAATSLLNGKDFFFLQGSATKVGRVKRIDATLIGDATHIGTFAIGLFRETSTPTTSGGAVTPVTLAPFDTASAAPTLVASTITPTVTNGGGRVALAQMGLGVWNIANPDTGGSGALVYRATLDFTRNGDEAPVLRGTSDFLALGCIGGAPTSSFIGLFVQVEESDT